MEWLALFAAAAVAQADPQQPPPPLPPEAGEEQLTAPPPPVPDMPTGTDARVRQLAYDPDQVVTLGVAPGYAAVVELAPDERVDNVVLGNSGVWQVTANHRGDRVIVKPLPGASYTNMIV